jgi:hypothetical protein
MPQNNKKYTIERLKGGFNRALPLHQYNQLVHFVAVRKLLAECPGDYVCYRWYHDRVAVATSEPDINEWLGLHGLENRSVEAPKLNNTGIQAQQTGQNGYSKSFSSDAMVDSKTLQAEIVQRLDAGATLTSIADELGCSPANIHYHRKKYNERMAKELEVDN